MGTAKTGVVSDSHRLSTPLVISNHKFWKTIEARSPGLQALFNAFGFAKLILTRGGVEELKKEEQELWWVSHHQMRKYE